MGSVLAVALIIGTVVWFRSDQPSAGRGVAALATARTSSDAPGSSSSAVTDSGDRTNPRLVWQSNSETDGAWIELTWSAKQVIREIVLVRPAGGPDRMLGGYFDFDDGSSLLARFSPSTTELVLPVTPRSVTRLRFTVSEVEPGARRVALAELIVRADETRRDVVADGGLGNSARKAEAVASASSDGFPPAGLTDGGETDLGDTWATDSPGSPWVELSWKRPRELTSVQLIGSPDSPRRVLSGTLMFGDGSTVTVGGITTNPGLPTLVGFMPRVTSSLRLTIDATSGSGRLALSEMRAFELGATAPAVAPAAESRPPPRSSPCGPPPAAPTSDTVTVICPLANTEVRGLTWISVALEPSRAVRAEVWSSTVGAPVIPEQTITTDATGGGSMAFDFASLPRGPVTVKLSSGFPEKPVYLQLYNVSREFTDDDRVGAMEDSRGKTLVYADEFEAPVSLSRDGTDALYAAAKPTDQGAEDFGEAIFPDPALKLDNLRTIDDRYLRLTVEPVPPGFADPSGGNRSRTGAMLASARTGGSGVSAQFGYFEARMLTPAGAGTWPAFWMLPANNLVSPQQPVAEIDTVELYGHDPTAACHSTHEYRDGKDTANSQCGKRFDSVQSASTWHTYAARVTPTTITYLIDGMVVATAPQVGGGDQAMFFMVNLALGGGWPVSLDGVGNRTAMYVDYVRVYV